MKLPPGRWAVHQPALAQYRCAASSKRERRPRSGDTRRGVAYIQARGVILKNAGSLEEFYALDPVRLGNEVLATARSPDVETVAVIWDSPGGSVDGVQDAHEAFREARKHARLISHADDCLCSAALWIAGGSDYVYASATAMVGSVGAMVVLADTSEMAKQLGVEYRIVASGSRKGRPMPGVKIDGADIAEVQRMVDALAGEFRRDLERGLRVPSTAMDTLSDGRVVTGREARAMGLVRQVMTHNAFRVTAMVGEARS